MSRVPHRLPVAKLVLIGAAFALGGCQSVASMRDPYPHDYRQRHPIMVGPQGAYVASQCGLWPNDLGAAPGSDSHLNRPHWNHGCASQHNLAAIVANPNDLLGPRQETEIDAARRQTVISRHRQGTAPGPHLDHQPIRSLTDIKREIKG
jgi:type IV pilus biogenesis protein CpaD/CtpE